MPLLAIADYTLFPGTLVPFHVYEPGLVEAVSHALTSDRRIVVLSPPDGRDAARVTGSIGRIVSDRRYVDGPIDIFIHGLERVSALCPVGPDPRFSVDVRVEPDSPHKASALAAERLRALATAYVRGLRLANFGEEAEAALAAVGSTRDPGLMSNRLAAFVYVRAVDRQRFLETLCPVKRCESLLDAIGQRLLHLNVSGQLVH